ncbi:hypothetical protein MVEN_01477200 [Mycena venus]|uniref:F-box domain-containing protein n=1 Tax=Mycena venus TaxID=2733690 RepID=A0A8H6XSF6_9AGAR|nr:hypothetical protein MVEN_01477200 [Mycena venus]
MPNIGLLVSDILTEIMSHLPSAIGQKFAIAQVSRFWRNVALDNHLFWSSFSGGPSKADCYRVPFVLERSGSAILHIQFSFTSGDVTNWHADAMKALIPYVSRIETLKMEFWVYSNHSVSPNTVEALLNSNLDFSALQTLRLEGPEYGRRPPLLLKAPRLRTLDIERFYPKNLGALLSPCLESIRLYKVGATLDTLLDIFDRCPRAWRVVLDSEEGYGSYDSRYSDDYFEAFTRRRPLAPALRELELRTANPDLGRVLKAAFPDVVLPTLTGCLYNSDIDVLSRALLPGLGPLVFFEIFDSQQHELRDAGGHVRRLQCWNEDSSFEADWVWEFLCTHYDLHRTVREIRISQWGDYAEMFERFPPQLPDGIILAFAASWDMPVGYPVSPEDEEDKAYMTKTMRIPGLAKVEFPGDCPQLLLKSVLDVLAHIEPPAARKVEVCIHGRKLLMADTEKDAFDVLQTTLVSRNCWTICSQCMSHCAHGMNIFCGSDYFQKHLQE